MKTIMVMKSILKGITFIVFIFSSFLFIMSILTPNNHAVNFAPPDQNWEVKIESLRFSKMVAIINETYRLPHIKDESEIIKINHLLHKSDSISIDTYHKRIRLFSEGKDIYDYLYE